MTTRATTRATKTTTKTKKPETLDLTLGQLCGQIDAYLGRDTGVHEAVNDYRRFSDEAAGLDSKGAFMSGLVEGISVHLDRAQSVPMIGARRIERVEASEQRQHRVSSEAVKQQDYGLWTDSGVVGTTLNVKTSIELVAVPDGSGTRFFTIQAAWLAWEKAKERRRFCERQRDAARDVLRDVFAEAAATWDGATLITSDGWRLGWSSASRFNAGRCIALAEERGVDLDPMRRWTVVQRGVSFRLVDPDETDETDGQ